MSDRRGDLGVPSKPIMVRPLPQHPFDPGSNLEPGTAAQRYRHLTRRRIMYLVGLATQAAVLGAVVAAGLAFEEPLRERFGLRPVEESTLAASVADVDNHLTELAGAVAALAEAVKGSVSAEPGTGTGSVDGEAIPELNEEHAAVAAPLPADVLQRLAALERLVGRVEMKLDDVRDAQLFPGPASGAGQGENGAR